MFPSSAFRAGTAANGWPAWLSDGSNNSQSAAQRPALTFNRTQSRTIYGSRAPFAAPLPPLALAAACGRPLDQPRLQCPGSGSSSHISTATRASPRALGARCWFQRPAVSQLHPLRQLSSAGGVSSNRGRSAKPLPASQPAAAEAETSLSGVRIYHAWNAAHILLQLKSVPHGQ